MFIASLLSYIMHFRKNKLTTLNSHVEATAPLPMTAKTVNEQLIVAAKEAGINLEDLEEAVAFEDTENQSSDDGAVKSSHEQSASLANAVSAAAEQLSGMMKKVKK